MKPNLFSVALSLSVYLPGSGRMLLFTHASTKSVDMIRGEYARAEMNLCVRRIDGAARCVARDGS